MSRCCGESGKGPFLEGLCDLLDGDENTALCEEFKKHLAGCERCQLVVDSLRKTIRVYSGTREVPLPPEFQKVLDELMKRKWEAKFKKPAG